MMAPFWGHSHHSAPTTLLCTVGHGAPKTLVSRDKPEFNMLKSKSLDFECWQLCQNNLKHRPGHPAAGTWQEAPARQAQMQEWS